ncbi:uncharacterized protein [Diadema setosum]|uniref:uncharacterized protein n=1 Tax=Diadema setosum TaxID=31175 RepID=UPI003B3A9D08
MFSTTEGDITIASPLFTFCGPTSSSLQKCVQTAADKWVGRALYSDKNSYDLIEYLDHFEKTVFTHTELQELNVGKSSIETVFAPLFRRNGGFEGYRRNFTLEETLGAESAIFIEIPSAAFGEGKWS